MSNIETVENILMVVVIVLLILYGIATLAETRPHWFRSKVFLRSRKI
jgi:hypothetical protein